MSSQYFRAALSRFFPFNSVVGLLRLFGLLRITCFFCLVTTAEARSVGYDAAGRVVWTIQPFGQMTTFAYDANGNLIAIGSVSASTDSDGDGIPDFFEIHYSGMTTGLDAGADNDGDGLMDLGEFAFAFDPTVADAFAITPVSIASPSGSSDRFFTLVYLRPQVGPQLLAYTAQVSFDLGQTQPWSSDPADVQEIAVVPLEGGVEEVTVRAMAPVDSQNKIFLRIVVDTL
jgi:YD repeat-containing protein